MNLHAKREDFVFESAKVTARSTDNWRSTLTLSKGSNAGVEKGDCVITETGLLVGVVANQQGVFPNYPEYKMEKYGQSMGAGGKLYRQGLIKMNEFVTPVCP